MLWQQGREYRVDVASGGESTSDTHFVDYCSSPCGPPAKTAPVSEPVVELRPAYPNPFSAQTNFRLSLQEATHVLFTVYDVSGREVGRLVDGELTPGDHRISWDGSTMPVGVYVYRLTSSQYVTSGKLIVMR